MPVAKHTPFWQMGGGGVCDCGVHLAGDPVASHSMPFSLLTNCHVSSETGS